MLAAGLPTRYGHVEFYSVAAQVMPLLLLAIVFEQRLFRRKNIPPLLLSVLSTFLVGLFVISEAVALRVLYVGYAHRQDQDWVIIPMLIAVVVLFIPVVLGPMFELERRKREFQFWIAVSAFAVVAIFDFVLLKVLFS
jgi:pilus assembly protein TadC